MEERNRRTSLQGVVTGTKMAKTIIVTVSTKRNCDRNQDGQNHHRHRQHQA